MIEQQNEVEVPEKNPNEVSVGRGRKTEHEAKRKA